MSNIAANIAKLFASPFRRVSMEEVIQQSLAAHEKDIVQANIEQLQEGIRPDGSAITPYYRPSTVAIKKAKGQPVDNVKLKDKGGFYKGTYAKVGRTTTEISSTDEKTANLTRKYGVVHGLTVASKEQVAQRMKPTVQQKFRDQLL